MQSVGKKIVRCSHLLCVLLVAACSGTSMNAMAEAKQAYQAQNYALSYDKVQPAAEQGDADAQYALGYMMYYGKGTKQDMAGSYAWFRRAAAQGQPQAIKALAALQQAGYDTAASTQLSSDESTAAVKAKQGAPVSTMPPASDMAGVKPSAVMAASTPKDVAEPSVRAVRPSQGASQIPPTGAAQWVSEQLLMQRSVDHYTIQMMAASKEETLRQFAERNFLQQVSIYQTQRHAKPWYVLLQGDYPSAAAANEVRASLAGELEAAKPWVRSLAPIQAGIRMRSERQD